VPPRREKIGVADFITTRVALIGTAAFMPATSICREVDAPVPIHGRAGLATLHDPGRRTHRPLRDLRPPVADMRIIDCCTVLGEVNR
jgi:hypothetical protein